MLFSASETAVIEDALPAASLTDISASQHDGALTVTMKTDRGLEPQAFRLENPPRLVLDFPNTVNKVPFMKLPLGDSAVKQLRVSQFQDKDPQIARIVIDLEKEDVVHEVTLDDNSVSITLHEEGSRDALSGLPPAPSAEPQLADAGLETPDMHSSSAAAAEEGQTAIDPDTLVSEVSNIQPESETVTPSTGNTPAPEEQVAVEKAPVEKEPNPVQESITERSPDKQREVPPLIASLMNPVAAQKNAPETNTTSRFSGQLLTLDFVDLPLVDFFRVMSEEAGINIVLDPKVKGNISIKVEKLPWDQIFDMVLVNHSLDKQIEGNLIRIASKSTLQEEANQREALKKAELLAADLETRVKRLNYAKAESLLNPLSDLKTVRGTVVIDERTNSLVLTDIPSSLDKMTELIVTLDIPQPQVEIEARIVSAARDFARDIGVQFGFVKGNLERITVGGPNTFGTIGGTRPSTTPNSTYVAGNPVTGRGAAEDTGSDSGAVSPGGAGNYNVNLPASKAFGGLGISIGNIFDTFLLDAALTAGESKGLAKLISQPKVTAQNNSPAVISQGTRFPVLVRANNTTTVQFYNAA
jgi:type IV pilus assembly protein PilQ